MSKYNNASSFLAKGSALWATKAAVDMVSINGMTAKRVAKPIPTKMEQKNSANTTSTKERVAPAPNGSANWISPPDSNLLSFG